MSRQFKLCNELYIWQFIDCIKFPATVRLFCIYYGITLELVFLSFRNFNVKMGYGESPLSRSLKVLFGGGDIGGKSKRKNSNHAKKNFQKKKEFAPMLSFYVIQRLHEWSELKMQWDFKAVRNFMSVPIRNTNKRITWN